MHGKLLLELFATLPAPRNLASFAKLNAAAAEENLLKVERCMVRRRVVVVVQWNTNICIIKHQNLMDGFFFSYILLRFY